MQFNTPLPVRTQLGGHSIVRTIAAKENQRSEIAGYTEDFIKNGGEVEVFPSFQDVSYKADIRHIGFGA